MSQREKRKYLKNMAKDQDRHFRSQLSNEARKVSAIGRNGYDVRGNNWNKAYRKGKVTNKDDADIKKAAKNTREYMKSKYGESAYKALQSSNVLRRKIKDFDVKTNMTSNKGKSAVKKVLKQQIKKSIDEHYRREQSYADYKRNKDRYDLENRRRSV